MDKFIGAEVSASSFLGHPQCSLHQSEGRHAAAMLGQCLVSTLSAAMAQNGQPRLQAPPQRT